MQASCNSKKYIDIDIDIELILHCDTATEGCVSKDFFRHSLDDSPASYLTLLPPYKIENVGIGNLIPTSIHRNVMWSIPRWSRYGRIGTRVKWIRCSHFRRKCWLICRRRQSWEEGSFRDHRPLLSRWPSIYDLWYQKIGTTNSKWSLDIILLYYQRSFSKNCLKNRSLQTEI